MNTTNISPGALFWGFIIGVIFAVLGWFFPDKIVGNNGGDRNNLAIGSIF